jgi:hypothetical protein
MRVLRPWQRLQGRVAAATVVVRDVHAARGQTRTHTPHTSHHTPCTHTSRHTHQNLHTHLEDPRVTEDMPEQSKHRGSAYFSTTSHVAKHALILQKNKRCDRQHHCSVRCRALLAVALSCVQEANEKRAQFNLTTQNGRGLTYDKEQEKKRGKMASA